MAPAGVAHRPGPGHRLTRQHRERIIPHFTRRRHLRSGAQVHLSADARGGGYQRYAVDAEGLGSVTLEFQKGALTLVPTSDSVVSPWFAAARWP